MGCFYLIHIIHNIYLFIYLFIYYLLQLKTEWWGAGVVICLERGADLHMAQLMSLPLTVSCFSKIQIGFTFLVPAHPGSPGKRAVKRVCVYLLQLLRAPVHRRCRRCSGGQVGLTPHRKPRTCPLSRHIQYMQCPLYCTYSVWGWLGSRVVSVLDPVGSN